MADIPERDMPETTDFGSSENLLAYIKEKSDDIEKVVIIPPGTRHIYRGQLYAVIKEFQIMLCFVGDKREFIGQHDAELLLNDGILNRMKLKIEFMKEPMRS